MMENENTRAGYVTIIGRPNAGKSTLLNSILQTKLSIVSSKPQTTRKRVLGIHSEDDFQMIFLDTPGLLDPKYKMQSNMMGYVHESIEEADVVLIVADLSNYRSFDSYFNKKFMKTIDQIECPKILVLNKIDTFKDSKMVLPIIAEITTQIQFDEVVPISALKDENTHNLIKAVGNHLPEGPFFYDPEQLSTQNERFFISEIIREKVFKLYGDELPYSTEVVISEFKEREMGKWYISADIIVERKSQKIIVIGKNGEKIKKLGQISREDVEDHLQMGVFLELFVKVRDGWRDNQTYLRSYGY